MRFTPIGLLLLASLLICSPSGLAQSAKKKSAPEVRARLLARLDTNGDGKIDKAERAAVDKRLMPIRRTPGDAKDTGPKAPGLAKPEPKSGKSPASKGHKPKPTKAPKAPRITTNKRKAPRPQGKKS